MATKITEILLETVPNAKYRLEDGKELFVKHCHVKNLSPRTIINYIQGIDRFIEYQKAYNPRSVYCGNIDRRDIDNYTLHLRHDAKMGEISINTYLRNLRAWLYFLMNEEQAIFPFKVRMIKANKPMKETYSDFELRALTMRPRMQGITFPEYRNWVIVNFLLATGVRASTLIEVRVQDVDFEGEYITLDYTKTRKAYRIPMDYELKLILAEYLEITEGKENEPLFITEDRKPLTYDGLKSAMERYNEKKGIKKTGIHIYRHTFAKKAVMNGMDVFSLQKILGHADLSTSRNYVEMFSEDIKEKFDTFSPLSNLLREKPKTKVVKTRSKRIDMSKLKG